MRITDTFLIAWRLHPRALLIVAAVLFGLVAVLTCIALAVRVSAGPRGVRPSPADAAKPQPPRSPMSSASATDVEEWNAKPTMAPAVTTAYPAIAAAERQDPTAYARAFAAELF